MSYIATSGNPIQGWSSFNINTWLSFEQISWPLNKSTTSPITKRQEIPMTLRNDTSLLKAKERIGGQVLLMRYGDLYQITTVMLPWSKDWCIPFKSKAASNWTTSYSVSILHSRYSATMLGHYNITHWWYDFLPIFITASVSTNIRILFSSSAIVLTYRYIESKELVIDVGNLSY